MQTTIIRQLHSVKTFLVLMFSLVLSISALGQNYSFAVEKIGSGNPVLFIPGLISPGEVWRPLAEQLSKNYECHVFTLPGYAGQPALPEGPYLDRFRDEILRYIDENELAEVQLVGHSIGGFLSMLIAMEDQKPIQQLVIVDALPFFAKTFNPNAQDGFDEVAAEQYMSSFANITDPEQKEYRLQAARFMTKQEDYWDRMTDWALKSDLKTEAYSSHEMFGTDIREKIKSIQIPMTVIAAFDDNPNYPMFTKEGVKEIYQEQYKNAPDARLIIAENSRHFIMLDQEEWLYNQLLSLLK